MTGEDQVHSQSTNISGATATAAAEALVGTPRVSVTLPIEWMVRGFLKAAQRFDEAEAASSGDARDGCIALFEAGNWIASLSDRVPLKGDAIVQGFIFARHRTHHHYAAAVYFDDATNAWTWYPESNLPLPEDEKDRSANLQPFYERHLAEMPVRNVLRHIEKLVTTLAPNADLT